MNSFPESGGEDSGDEASRGQSTVGPMTKYEGHGRLLVDNEGNLDPSVLRRTSGYIMKKGGAVNARGGFRNWKRRWFALVPVDFLGHVGYELHYLDSPGGALKGSISLSDVEIYCEAKSRHKKVRNEFQIKLQTGGVLQLSVDDETERDEWLETLTLVVAYLNKITTDSAMTLDGYDPAFEDDEVVYRLGEEVAQNCHAMGPGLFGAEAGQTASFVVQIHDLLGQKVTRGNMPMTATLSNTETLYHLTVVDHEDGSYLVQYTLGRAGAYQLAVKLNDEHHIFGSPFDISILPSRTAARCCEAEGDVLHAVALGGPQETHAFTIQARDGFGNAKQRGGDPFEVGLMGPATLTGLRDNGDGSYTCTVQTQTPPARAVGPRSPAPSTSGAVMVLVTLHGKHIAGSPFKPALVDAPRAQVAAVTPLPASLRAAAAASAASKVPAPAPASAPAPAQPPAPSPAVSISAASVSAPVALPPPSALRVAMQPLAAASSSAPPAFVSGPTGAYASSGANDDVGALHDAHPMSRLERSRQRALLAKQISSSQTSQGPAPRSPIPGSSFASDASRSFAAADLSSPPPAAAPRTSVINKSLNINALGSPPMTAAGASPVRAATKLSVLAQRSAQTLNAKRQQDI